MAFKDINEGVNIVPRGRRANPGESTLNLYKAGNGYQICMKVAPIVADLMRWQIGDRIQVMADEDNKLRIFLKRVPSGGYALTGNGARGKQSSHKILQMTFKNQIPIEHGRRYACSAFEEFDGGVIVEFREDAASRNSA